MTLNFMIASSGPAETNADKAAAAAWGKSTGNKVNVINASNLTLQLTEAFSGGTPPDVFYGETPMFESMAKNDQLLPSGASVDPAERLLSVARAGVYLRPHLLLRTEGLVDLGHRDQHRPCGKRPG